MTVALSALSAAKFSAEGIGDTAEEARFAAQVSLASQFSSTIFSHQRLSISEITGGWIVSGLQHFAPDDAVDVSLSLLGVRFSESRYLADGSVAITASLDESMLPRYLTELQIIKGRIDEIERLMGQILDDGQRLANLLLLLGYYDDFAAYASVARALDSAAVLPELTRTKAGVELDYWNFLDRQERDLEQRRMELWEAVEDASLRQEASVQLREIQVQLDANLVLRQRWQETLAKRQENALFHVDERMWQQVVMMQQEANAGAMRISTAKKSVDPLELVTQIEEKKQRFSSIEDELNWAIDLRKDEIFLTYHQKATDVELEPYRKSEMVGGKPTANALKIRRQRIDKLFAERDLKIKEAVQHLERSVAAQKETLRSAILKEYQELEKNTYSRDITTEKAQINIGEYDGSRNSWPVALRFTLLDVPFSMDFYVPYEAVTGLKIPNLRPKTGEEQLKYEEYLDQVNLFDTYFSTTKNSLHGTLTYRVFVGKRPSTYRIVLQAYALGRTDTGKTILSENVEFPGILEEETYQSRPAFSIEDGYTSVVDKELARTEGKEKRKQEFSLKMQDPNLFPQHLLATVGIGWGVLNSPSVTSDVKIDVTGSVIQYNKKLPWLGYGMWLYGVVTKDTVGSYMAIAAMVEGSYPLSIARSTHTNASQRLFLAFCRASFGVGFNQILKLQDFKANPHMDLSVGVRLGGHHVLAGVYGGVQIIGPMAGSITVGCEIVISPPVY